MKEFFSMEGPFMQFFAKLWDVILLSIVFCICSIPIVTFGMNCIALYYTIVKVVLPGERHAVRTFLRAVPRNAKQGFALGILFEIVIAILAYSMLVILHNDMGAAGVFFGVVFVMLFMIVLVVMAYAFPMSARFQNTIGEIIANSAFMALEHWKETTSLLILQAVFIVGMVLIVYIPPIVLILPGAIVWMQAKLLEPVFEGYLKEGGVHHETETI